jgi:hypothetical protein
MESHLSVHYQYFVFFGVIIDNSKHTPMIEAGDAINAEMETITDDWQQTIGDIRLQSGLWFEAFQS